MLSFHVNRESLLMVLCLFSLCFVCSAQENPNCPDYTTPCQDFETEVHCNDCGAIIGSITYNNFTITYRYNKYCIPYPLHYSPCEGGTKITAIGSHNCPGK